MKKYNFLKLNNNIIFREEGKDGILFDSEKGEFSMLNSTAVLIIKMCNGKNTEEDIINQILEKYNYSYKKQIIKDVKQFLEYLIKNNFILKV